MKPRSVLGLVMEIKNTSWTKTAKSSKPGVFQDVYYGAWLRDTESYAPKDGLLGFFGDTCLPWPKKRGNR